MKLLTKKIFGTIIKLYLDENYTLVCQVDSILISSPLKLLSKYSTDLQLLTTLMLIKGFNTYDLPIVRDISKNNLEIDEIWKRGLTICKR